MQAACTDAIVAATHSPPMRPVVSGCVGRITCAHCLLETNQSLSHIMSPGDSVPWGTASLYVHLFCKLRLVQSTHCRTAEMYCALAEDHALLWELAIPSAVAHKYQHVRSSRPFTEYSLVPIDVHANSMPLHAMPCHVTPCHATPRHAPPCSRSPQTQPTFLLRLSSLRRMRC